MHTHPRTRGLALAAAFLVVAAAGPAAAESLEKTLQKSYPLTAGGEVVVENVNGHVTVESWDRGEVRVRATKKVRASSAEEAAAAMERLKVNVQAGPDSLHIGTERFHKPQTAGFIDWLRGRHSNASISYHLTVPRGVRLVAETVNGGITLRAVDGDFSASTTNGAVRIEEARGRVDVSTTNGSIKAEMAEVTPNADLTFATTNGAVTVTLPEDVATSLRLRTTNGGIKVDFPVEVDGRSNRRRVDADLNGGGGTLRVNTTNGSINIKRG